MAEAQQPEEQRRLRDVLSRDLVEALIRVGMIGLLVVFSYRIFSPFLGLMLWALILAVALYPANRWLATKLGGRPGAAATLIVIAGMVLIGWPTINLGSSFVGEVHHLYEQFSTNSVTVAPPDPAIAEWPLVGEKLHSAWTAAAADLPAFLEQMQPQLGNLARTVLGFAASTMGSVLLFLGAFIIAGVMMAYGQDGSDAMRRIFCRFAGPVKGPRLHVLSTATIRSVATGVIGVAFIQALLLGLGFAFAGIPAAGILAVIVLLVGIVQLPAAIISLPAIGYLWWAGDSTTSNLIWTIYLFAAGMADNVLKPLLLGRGIEVPMPVVLIGALGGMAGAGMVGLFLGAVLLAVGYQVFMDWVNDAPGSEGEAVPSSAEGESAGTGGKTV